LAKYKSENNDYLFEYFKKESQKLSSKKSSQPCPSTVAKTDGSTFTDKRDNKTYRTVKIGKLMWMAENLNFQPILGSRYYTDDNDDCAKYGRLYTWGQAQTICPAGWRLPTCKEWDDLVNVAGGADVAGTKLKSKSPDWNGTDDFGFSALPGGFCRSDKFNNVGTEGWWWCDQLGSAFFQFMDSGKIKNLKQPDKYYSEGDFGFSLRCVRDVRP
jgi:uncharacterized protein (TIGR02145 family)